MQAQLDRFATYSNTVRPHRALGRRTPAQAFAARTKATPRRAAITVPSEHRVRRDRVDNAGKVTLRYRSTLLHLGIGRRYAGTRVVLVVAVRDVRVINNDGELLAQFTIDPPPRPTKHKHDPDNTLNVVRDVSRHHTAPLALGVLCVEGSSC